MFSSVRLMGVITTLPNDVELELFTAHEIGPSNRVGKVVPEALQKQKCAPKVR
jgi:hypothetical protein